MHQFRSRVSVILIVLLFASVLPVIFAGKPNANVYLAYGILFGSIGIVLLFLFRIRYEIAENLLVIKMSPFGHNTIRIDEIEKIERSYNPLSSPSASFKRLYVKANGKDTLISPVNEQEFIRVLTTRNPEITVQVNDNNVWWHFWNWDV